MAEDWTEVSKAAFHCAGFFFLFIYLLIWGLAGSLLLHAGFL